jgi:hypothetical protein
VQSENAFFLLELVNRKNAAALNAMFAKEDKRGA